MCERATRLRHWIPEDPRVFQILLLGILLAAGVWLRDFSLYPAQLVLTFATGLLAQCLAWFFDRSKPRSLRSAMITSLSLTLLLRADNLIAHPIAALAAIASKSVFRFRDKHLFNPATFGLVFAMLTMPGAWISPGQWGHDVAAAGWMISLGVLVTSRARRGDVSWAFLAFYLGGVAARVWWLGQYYAVWAHQLTNGALLLFAFFMISDPMTTPNARRGRICHAAVVALTALVWQYGFYFNNGLIWALFLTAPAVPVWDAISPASKYEWTQQGVVHGTSDSSEMGTAAPGDRDARFAA